MAIRIQMDVDESGRELMNGLKKKSGLRTDKDLLNNALTLLKWAIKEVEAGRPIVSIAEDGSHKELIMPCLEHAAQKE